MDIIDQRLLALLSRNARMTNRDLATTVGLSPSTCLERIRRLEADGTILGYAAVLAERPSGKPIEGWAGLRLEDPLPTASEMLLVIIRDAKMIVEAYQVSGRFDYALRFIASTMDDLQAFQTRLQEIGCVTHTRITILLDKIK